MMNETSHEKPWYRNWPKNVLGTIDLPQISIHERFRQVAALKPNDPFLSFLNMNYSYGMIDELSGKFADYLTDQGIGKGSNVGLLMPNLPQFASAFFGILKTRATAVLLNPLSGTEDLKFMINDSEVGIIVALDMFYGNLNPIRSECSRLEKILVASVGELLSAPKRMFAEMLGKIPKLPELKYNDEYYLKTLRHLKHPSNHQKQEPVNVKEDAAVLAYSGGTTGRSKGIMLTHFNIMSNLAQAREWASQVKSGHRFVGAVPFFHLTGLTTVFLAAMHFEGSVTLVPNPRDIPFLLKTIHRWKPSYFHGVPTLFRAILNHPALRKYSLSSLEIIFSGSAPLPADLAERFINEATDGSALMVEAYGMTELSPMASANPIEKDGLRFGSIGMPISNTDMKIIDIETGKEVKQGETGEIAVKGPQVMKGYWKNPEETSRIMTPDGYLRTGDIGYIDGNGYFFIVDRLKDMIISSGYKIFPTEVENFLTTHPAISEAAVIGMPDEYRGESPKAFIVLRDVSASLTAEDFRAYCEGKIAKYKIPSAIEILTELPKTAIGKIDRKVLRQAEA